MILEQKRNPQSDTGSPECAFHQPGEDHLTGTVSVNAVSSRDKKTSLAMCEGLIDIMAALFTVPGKHLRSPKRHGRDVARVRQIGMYVAHVALGISMTIVGIGFARDKSTVAHACHLIEDLREDDEFDALVSRVEIIVRVAFNFGLSQQRGGESE